MPWAGSLRQRCAIAGNLRVLSAAIDDQHLGLSHAVWPRAAATRFVYLLIGGALIGYGYKLMVLEGGFGQIGGNPILHSLGFISTFVGFAAILAVPAQILSRKVEASLDVAPSPQKEVKMSVTEACSLMPVDPVETVYRDRRLVAAAVDESSDELRGLCESLTAVGFNPAQPMYWELDETTSPAVIQIGCQDMVVADMEQVNGRIESRMISMLHDGMVVITLAPDVQVESDRRVGSNGIYTRSRSDDPGQMLAGHLEQTISIAEKRDTSVVNFDANEADDVCRLARRVFADIQYQYGESNIDVDSACYGRFRFPIQPVADTAVL